MQTREYLAVAPDRVVSLRYIMRNRHNEVIEDRMNGAPAIYLQGSGAILRALQIQLEGLQPGQQKQVTLYLEPAGGVPDYLFEVEILSVRTATAAELSLGYPLPVGADCGTDCGCYSELPVGGVRPESESGSL